MPRTSARSSGVDITKVSNTQLILQMVQCWPEDIPFDQAMYHLGVLQAVVENVREPGEDIDHDEVFRQLLDDEEENSGRLAARRKQAFRGNQGSHRATRQGPP